MTREITIEELHQCAVLHNKTLKFNHKPRLKAYYPEHPALIYITLEPLRVLGEL